MDFYSYKMARSTLVFVLLFLLFAEVETMVANVKEKTINEIETRYSMTDEKITEMLNSVLVKSRRNMRKFRRVKRSKAWLGYVAVSPYCIPASIDCPCGACGYCCKGQCNASSSTPCTC